MSNHPIRRYEHDHHQHNFRHENHNIIASSSEFRNGSSMFRRGLAHVGNEFEGNGNNRGKVVNLNVKSSPSENRFGSSGQHRMDWSTNSQFRRKPERSNSFMRNRGKAVTRNYERQKKCTQDFRTRSNKIFSTTNYQHGSCARARSTPTTRKMGVRSCKLSFDQEMSTENEGKAKCLSDLKPNCSRDYKCTSDFDLFYEKHSENIRTDHPIKSEKLWKNQIENQANDNYNCNNITITVNNQLPQEEEYTSDGSYLSEKTSYRDAVELGIQEENIFSKEYLGNNLQKYHDHNIKSYKECDESAECIAECPNSYQDNPGMASMDLSDVSDSSFVDSNNIFRNKQFDGEQSNENRRNDDSTHPEGMSDLTKQLHYYKDQHNGMLEVIFDLNKSVDRKESIIRDLRNAETMRRDKEKGTHYNSKIISENDMERLERVCRMNEKKIGEMKSNLNWSNLKIEELNEKYSDLKHAYRSLRCENERLKFEVKIANKDRRWKRFR